MIFGFVALLVGKMLDFVWVAS
jgi:hypothetical protein